MFRKKIFLFFSILLFPLISFAQTPAEQLRQILGNLQGLQAHFVQTVFDGNHNVLQQSNGEMILQRPGLFRWEVVQPSKQILIADGKKVWFYDIELEQVTVQKQSTLNENSPAMLLSGSDQQLTQDFFVQREAVVRSGQQIFKLTPKAESNLFQSVQLVFEDNQIKSMRLVDNLEQVTVINFSALKINPVISKDLFRFTVPKDVDVVTEG